MIALERGEKKENKSQAAAPKAPLHADFRGLTRSALILQIFQRVSVLTKVGFYNLSQMNSLGHIRASHILLQLKVCLLCVSRARSFKD